MSNREINSKIAHISARGIVRFYIVEQQFPFWYQDLTGFRNFYHLWLGLSLDRCFERQFLGKDLSGLVRRFQ
jgi:hypothetical protein